MKKIKSIKHLHAEKKRIHQHQEMLEMKIRNNWTELKLCLTPYHLAGEAINYILKNKTAENLNSDSILKNTFTYGITLLANKLINNAGEKMSKVFKI